MKHIIALFAVIALTLSNLAIASDDTSHLCVAYQSGPDASNAKHWTTSRIFVGDISNCDKYVDKTLLVGQELDNGYVVKEGDTVDVWCDTSDDIDFLCM